MLSVTEAHKTIAHGTDLSVAVVFRYRDMEARMTPYLAPAQQRGDQQVGRLSGFEPLLTKSQVAQILGCSVRAVEVWIARGQLGVTRPGGTLIRIAQEDLRSFLESARSMATSDMGAN